MEPKKYLTAKDNLYYFKRKELAKTVEEENEIINILVKGNQRLVRMAAQKYVKDPDYEDILQEGYLGLLSAIDTFSLQYNVCFSTFAYTCIRNKMLDYIYQKKSLIHVPRSIHNKAKENTDEAKSYQKLIQDLKPLSLEWIQSALEEEVKSNEDVLAALIANEEKKSLLEKIYKLTQMEQAILFQRYTDNEKRPTQAELAKKYDTSISGICRIEQRAIQHLREQFKKEEQGDNICKRY